MTTPREYLHRQLDNLDDLVDDGTITHEERDAVAELADALDKETTRRKYLDERGSEKTLEPGTIANYTKNLRLCLQRGCPLLECSAEEFNEFIDGLHDDQGLTKGTLCGYQSAARRFFHYHDLGVDPDDIHTYQPDKTPRHDEQDMFTDAEVDALRDACDTPRNRAFLELLIFTGQRITALRTLRVRDVDPQKGVIYLNPDADGLKGARNRGRKRPMFGARKYVRDWLEYHPCADDPDAPLWVGDPDHHMTDLSKPISGSTIRQHLEKLARRADVDKPVNPHNFRHYFVTVMKRDYGMDSDTLKSLLGVAADSAVLDTVYSHVTNDDYVRKAEETLGYREAEETTSPMTPDSCPTCGEILQDHWRRCPACNEVFGPDLEQLADETDTATDEALDEALDSDDPLSAEEREAFRTVLDAIGDPVALADELEGQVD